MDHQKRVEILVQEIRDQETEIRQQLRVSTQNATLSIAIISAAGAYFAQYNLAALCVLPIFLNVAALSNLNTAIDVAHQAIVRDNLQEWANRELSGDVFTIGKMAGVRRLPFSGIAVNLMAALILVASWVVGIVVSWNQPWVWGQVIGTAVLILLSGLAVYDYATIRRNTQDKLDSMDLTF